MTDGETECTNRTIEDILYNYINYKQYDWDTWLRTRLHVVLQRLSEYANQKRTEIEYSVGDGVGCLQKT